MVRLRELLGQLGMAVGSVPSNGCALARQELESRKSSSRATASNHIDVPRYIHFDSHLANEPRRFRSLPSLPMRPDESVFYEFLKGLKVTGHDLEVTLELSVRELELADTEHDLGPVGMGMNPHRIVHGNS